MKGCWTEATVRKIAVALAKASKQAAKIVDGVGWQDVRAKVEGAYHYIEKTFNENPKLFYVAIGVVGGAAAALLVMPAVLGVAGFSGIGPVAGSMAAGLQSAGWAGAAFSTVQSAAMGGYGLLAVAGIFTAVGAAVGGAVGATASFIVAACKKKKS